MYSMSIITFNDIMGNIMTPIVLLDTNILLAGLSSQLGASFVLLEYALNERFRLLASPALWLEYEAVLKRPEILQMHQLSINPDGHPNSPTCGHLKFPHP